MSKQKILAVLSDRFTEVAQKLSMGVYVNKMSNKPFDFDVYFDITNYETIPYVLEVLDKEWFKYKEIFHKYLLMVHDETIRGANMFLTTGIPIRQTMTEWALKNNKEFLKEIMDTYSSNIQI